MIAATTDVDVARTAKMSFADSIAAYAALTVEDLDRPWAAGPAGTNLRFPLMQAQTDEEVEASRFAPPATFAARTQSRAQAAFGDLRGLLAGLPEMVLDDRSAGGWTIRQVLDHCVRAEVRNIAYLQHATTRQDTDPLDVESSVALAPEDRPGGISDWIALLAGTRRQAAGAARRLDDALVVRPAAWAGTIATVEFRLARIAAHYNEHAIECEKVLAAMGLWPAEGRQLARRVSAARGAHELFSAPARLVELDARHAERAAQLVPA